MTDSCLNGTAPGALALEAAPGEVVGGKVFREKPQAGSLDAVPSDVPALEQALAISRIAVGQGFEWGSVEGVWAKVAEEVNEFKEASGPAEKELEFGDVLFSLVNVARWEGVDPEAALLATCRKFRWRWGRMEQAVRDQGQSLSDLNSEELLAYWRQAKQDEKRMGIDYV